jgi:hypothetical protein
MKILLTLCSMVVLASGFALGYLGFWDMPSLGSVSV